MPLHGRRFAGGSATTSSPPPLGDGGSGSSGTGGTTLANNATGTGSINLGNSKGVVLNSIQASIACRIRFYGSSNEVKADKNRKIGTPPKSYSICEAEFLFSTPNQTIIGNPPIVLQNGDSPQTALIYYSITNLSGGPANVLLTMNYVPYI